MRKSRGFSLIELLIVIAIILIIAAIAIPSLLNSRRQANEAAAVATIRTIGTAQATYSSMFSQIGYSDKLSNLGPAPGGTPTPTGAGLLDGILACATQPCDKSGYKFAIVNPSGNPVINYGITAVPITVGITGVRGFCSKEAFGPLTIDSAGGTSCTQPLN